MADITKTVAILFQGENKTQAAIGEIERGLEGAAQSGKKLGDISQDIDEIANKALNARDAIKGMFAGVSLNLFADAFISANAAAEKLTLQMKQVTGSAEGAAQATQYVKDIAERFGITISAAADSYAGFAAATKGTELEGEKAKIVFEAFAGTIVRFGGTAADVHGAFVQLAQGIGRGRLELEDLKSIAERVPGGFNRFAEALGITTGEIFKLVEAGKFGNDQIFKIAVSMRDTSAVDSYAASMNRAKNAFDELLVTIGNSGALNAIVGVLKDIGAVTKTTVGEVELIVTAFRGLANVARGGSFDTFIAELDLVKARMSGTAKTADDELNQSLAETARLARTGKQDLSDYSSEMKKLERQNSAQAESLKEVEEAYKTLGVKVRDSAEEFTKTLNALKSLGGASDFKADGFLEGFSNSLKKATNQEDLDKLKAVLVDTFVEGKFNVERLGPAFDDLIKRQKELADPTNKAAEALKKQEDQMKKARDAAERMGLELEKIASNERIKIIEATVKINTEQVKADAERVKAAFASIDKTIESTGSVINNAFDALVQLTKNPFIDSKIEEIIRKQIDSENQLRKDAAATQRKLIDAQIAQIQAQTNRLNAGNPLIQVDGSGMKPHLEAIMWELLKAIQVRINQEGLDLLTGV